MAKCYWTKEDIFFIKTIEDYPILYGESLTNVNDLAVAWKEVSRKMNKPVPVCKRRFIDLKFKYAILKKMLGSGELTKEDVRKKPSVLKFLNGMFDFLDPHISLLLGNQYPVTTIKFYKSLQLLATKSKKKFLRKPKSKINSKVIENSFEERNGFPQDIGVQTKLPMELNESKDAEDIGNETFSEVPIENNTIKENSEEYIISDLTVPVDVDIVTDVTPETIQMFLMKYSDENDAGLDIKQYFNDLAEMLSARLVLGKRQNFLNHIDLLVSEILEG